ncbi:MAG TPA: hypothetical protein VFA81_05760 [Burkholderiales bacterium]|nr:hypothetical protein [Burkholderiales bacterium]
MLRLFQRDGTIVEVREPIVLAPEKLREDASREPRSATRSNGKRRAGIGCSKAWIRRAKKAVAKVMVGGIALATLLSARPAAADSLQSVPETFNERYFIAIFCDATIGLQASDAARAAAARFIARYKPNLDCEKEYVPSLVSTYGDRRDGAKKK